MSEYQPVTTLEDLNSLNGEEIIEGYHSGRAGDPEPGNNRSRSFWHGWRNGRADGRFAEIDDAQRALAALVVAESRRVAAMKETTNG